MTKQSTPLYILRLALTLLVITGVVAAALAGVNAVTAPIIQKINEEKTQQAIEAVLPGGGEAVEGFSDASGIVKALYMSAETGGIAVHVAPKGFNGNIEMMVGFNLQREIVGISIISHTETAGLGAVAAAQNSAGESFRSQYAGQSDKLVVGENIDAITGATITSRAVTEGVNAARELAMQIN